MARLPDDDDELFAALMGDVAPLGSTDRVPVEKAAPARPVVAAPTRFEIDETGGRGPGVNRRQLARLHRGDPAPTERVDLHGLRRDPARNAVTQRVLAAAARGGGCLLVVHGRGRHSIGEPVLREVVISALTSAPLASLVRAFSPARSADGGSGALYVLVGAS